MSIAPQHATHSFACLVAVKSPPTRINRACSHYFHVRFEELAKQSPTVSFIHSFPGAVKTGWYKETNPLIRATINFVFPAFAIGMNIISLEESGERHLYLCTCGRLPGRNSSHAIPSSKKESLMMRGSSGQKGGGAYLIGEYGQFAGNEEVLAELRKSFADFKVWEHTLDEFKRVTGTPEYIARC